MKLISLSKNGKNKGKYFAKVDDEDFEFLNRYNWFVETGTNTFYARTNINKKPRPIHRLILGLTDPKILCDHIDGDGLNNQRTNLRIATQAENQKNKKPLGSSKYLGVNYHIQKKKYTNKNGEIKIYFQQPKWRAQISINTNKKHLGLFETEIEAAKAYDIAARIHHKEFANLNFK